MKAIACGREHGTAILAILNDVIATSTALYDYKPRDMTMMNAWLDSKEKGSFPVIGLVDEADRLLGFGTYGPFRPHPAYKYSVEHSIYVDERFRRRGAGRRLLKLTIEAARDQGYHNLIAGIDAGNTASIALHRELGFECCGTVKHAGFKFGQWLDLQFFQLIFEGPPDPVDGDACAAPRPR